MSTCSPFTTALLACLLLLCTGLFAAPTEEDLPPAAPRPSLGGTEQAGLFQKMLAGPLAQTPQIIFATRQPAREWHFFANTGHVAVVDPSHGPGAWEKVTYLTEGEKKKGGEIWRDPFPITGDCFLVAAHNQLYVMDGMGNYEAFFSLPDSRTWVHEPRPLVPREREPIIPERTDYSEDTGQLILSSAHIGRNMGGVEAGDVRKLLVLEVLPKPISWGHPSKIRGAGHNIKRILGTIPVEADGSAHMELPAMRALMFVLLDENDRAIKRMRSFITVKPGEVTSCVGCHEQRTQTVRNRGRETLLALERGPSQLTFPAAAPADGLVDFQRDIQPMLDQHCVACHNSKREKSNIVLDGAVQPSDAQGYRALSRMTRIGKGHGNDDPYTVGSGNSPLLDLLEGGHAEVQLDPEELARFRLWIDAGQRYAATYAAMTPGQDESIGVSDNKRDQKRGLTAMIDARVFTQRCDDCHGVSQSGARRYVRDGHFDLSRPERSLLILAPLAKESGGLGHCRAEGAAPGTGEVFADTTDEDYQALLAEIQKAAEALDADNRYWEPGFVADPVYIREMIRYGVLPEDFDPKTPIDPYATDDAYYELFYPSNRRLGRNDQAKLDE